MRNPIIFNSEKKIEYLFSPANNQFLIIHPLFRRVLTEKQSNSKINEDNLTDYYRRKYEFLKVNGYFDNKKEKYSKYTPDQIENEFYNSKNIVFEVTEECNLKCRYCSWGELYSVNNNRNNKKLSFTKSKALIDFYFSHQKIDIPEIGIGFYGGEPLLNYILIKKIVTYLKSKKPAQQYRFFMTTNGLLLHKYHNFLVENDFHISISLDGNAEHNQYRVFPNGKSSYSYVSRNIEFFRKLYPTYFSQRITFLSVLHAKNKREEVENIFKDKYNVRVEAGIIRSSGLNIAKIKEFKEISGNFEIEESKNNNLKETDNSKNNFINIQLFNEYLKKSFNSYINVLNKYKSENKRYFPNSTCNPFQVRIFLSAEGKIYPCEKIGTKDDLGYIDEAGKLFLDFKSISLKYNNYSRDALNLCSKCYKINCKLCYYQIHNEDITHCSSFINEKALKNIFSDRISKLEIENKSNSN